MLHVRTCIIPRPPGLATKHRHSLPPRVHADTDTDIVTSDVLHTETIFMTSHIPDALGSTRAKHLFLALERKPELSLRVYRVEPVRTSIAAPNSLLLQMHGSARETHKALASSLIQSFALSPPPIYRSISRLTVIHRSKCPRTLESSPMPIRDSNNSTPTSSRLSKGRYLLSFKTSKSKKWRTSSSSSMPKPNPARS